jgi:hypothetical protein
MPKFWKPFKIAALTFGLGPAIGNCAFWLASFCLSAMLDPQNQASSAALLLVITFTLIFAYPYALVMTAVAALLAPLVDYIAPALIPRRVLGATLGGVCGWMGYHPINASMPDNQFQERAVLAFAGGVAGFFVAWVCDRAGWTKSAAPEH